MSTTEDLRNALAALVRETGDQSLELVRWAPGDGKARYRIERMGQEPFGSTYWTGRDAAYHGIWHIIAGIRWAKASARGAKEITQ